MLTRTWPGSSQSAWPTDRATRPVRGRSRPVGHRSQRGGFRRIFALDLVLLHAPSVWDFRQEVILQGPLDVVPSTDEFEIYPIRLTSIAAYLEANNYNTRIVNLAYRMLRPAPLRCPGPPGQIGFADLRD